MGQKFIFIRFELALTLYYKNSCVSVLPQSLALSSGHFEHAVFHYFDNK